MGLGYWSLWLGWHSEGDEQKNLRVPGDHPHLVVVIGEEDLSNLDCRYCEEQTFLEDPIQLCTL